MSVLGKRLLKYFFIPIVSPLQDNGGPWGYMKVKLGKRAMKKSSQFLKIPDFGKLQTTVTIVAVAGKRNWYQMIFCLYSFYKTLGFNLKTTVIDDGTIDDLILQSIKSQVPFVEVIMSDIADPITSNRFDSSKYPTISGIINSFVVFKKIFHARTLVSGPVLVLDADMLFYRKPEELVNWINNPEQPIYMHDKYSIYGIKNEFINKSLSIRPNVNTGIIGFNNDVFDLDKLERLTCEYLSVDELNYLMEQALYAMYINDIPAICLSPADYEILPTKDEARIPKAVMHHFPTEHRAYYYRYAWKNITN
jgi:hypothetical protein